MSNNRKRTTPNGTSFEEQAIFYYVKNFFPDAINRGKYSFYENEKIELDIYIPCLRLAIEYDGAYWHTNKVASDNTKNILLFKAGINLIRIRECDLDDLPDQYGDVLYRTITPNDNGLELHAIIVEVIKIINNYIKNDDSTLSTMLKKSISCFSLSKEKLIDDRPNIYAQYYTDFQDDNIATTCLIKFWDYEKNGPLCPENVSIRSHIYISLTCPEGEHFLIQPSRYDLRSLVNDNKCKDCFFNYCPSLYSYCPKTTQCAVYKNLTKTVKYMPATTQTQYKKLDFANTLEVSEIDCSFKIIDNLKIHYERMWKEIENTLIYDHESITKDMVVSWLQSALYEDRHKMLYLLWSLGKKYSAKLITLLKDIFLKPFDSPSCSHFSIKVDPSFPKKDTLKLFQEFGGGSFVYPSLQYFDEPIIMEGFCNLVFDEHRHNHNSLYNKSTRIYWQQIQKEYQTFSASFSAYLYILITKLEQFVIFPHAEECKALLFSKAESELPALQNNVANSIINDIQLCTEYTPAQIRCWIDGVTSPQKEKIIYLLYKKNLLNGLGDKNIDRTGRAFVSKNLSFDFIKEPNTLLDIMWFLGAHRFKYDIKLFDQPLLSSRFIELLKKGADAPEESLISGYNSYHLNKEISNNIHALSLDFLKQLYTLILYLSSSLNRPSPCWIGRNYQEVLRALEKEIRKRKKDLSASKMSAAPTVVPSTTTKTAKQPCANKTPEINNVPVAKNIGVRNDDFIENNANSRLLLRSKGLCQHCGGKFKRKFLFFGDFICSNCGKRKDYS